jgi:hypothetical protein
MTAHSGNGGSGLLQYVVIALGDLQEEREGSS